MVKQVDWWIEIIFSYLKLCFSKTLTILPGFHKSTQSMPFFCVTHFLVFPFIKKTEDGNHPPSAQFLFYCPVSSVVFVSSSFLADESS